MKFDSVIIGGGITGVQSAIDIADQGYQVAILERKPSIGGKMVKTLRQNGHTAS